MGYETPERYIGLHRVGRKRLSNGVWTVCVPLIVTAENWLFARADYESTLRFAPALPMQGVGPGRMPSIDEIDRIYDEADHVLTPVTMIPDGSITQCRTHDAEVLAQLKKIPWTPEMRGKLVAGIGKHWIEGAPKKRSYLKGWRKKDGTYIQKGTKTGPGPHNDEHEDYSSTIVLMWGEATTAKVVVPEKIAPSPAADLDLTNYVEPVACDATPREVHDALFAAWHLVLPEEAGEASSAAIRLLLAQFSIETGKLVPGAKKGGFWCWNLGNVKGGPRMTPSREDVTGRKWTMLNRVREIIGGKNVYFDPPHPQTHFRAFDSLAQGAAAWLLDLWTEFRTAWDELLSGDGSAYAAALKREGYYTAPLDTVEIEGKVHPGYRPALLARLRVIDELLSPLHDPAYVDRLLAALGFCDADRVKNVKAFQAGALDSTGAALRVDGVIGPKTLAALAEWAKAFPDLE